VHGTALDKRPHDHYEGHAHQNHQIPVIDDPLGHRLQSLPVEQQILQSHQRPICIHGSTLEEHIAVALEVVARRTWLQTYATLLDVIFIRKLAGAATSGGVIAILTGQVAQLALIHMWQRGRGEETLGHVPQQTWRSTAFTPNAQCSSIVAHGLVIPMTWLRTLSRRSIAGARPAALRLLLALLMVTGGHKGAGVGQAARTLRWRALRLGPASTALGTGVQRLVVLADQPRVATLVLAFVLIEPTVALLAGLHDLVAAEGTLRGLETVPLRVAHQHVEHIRDVPNGAG